MNLELVVAELALGDGHKDIAASEGFLPVRRRNLNDGYTQ
jgi:hypothetical protein